MDISGEVRLAGKGLDEKVADANREMLRAMGQYHRAALRCISLGERSGRDVRADISLLAPQWLQRSLESPESKGAVLATNRGYVREPVIGVLRRFTLTHQGIFNEVHLWCGSSREQRFRVIRDGSMVIIEGIVQSRRAAVFKVGGALNSFNMNSLECEFINDRAEEFEVYVGLHLQDG